MPGKRSCVLFYAGHAAHPYPVNPCEARNAPHSWPFWAGSVNKVLSIKNNVGPRLGALPHPHFFSRPLSPEAKGGQVEDCLHIGAGQAISVAELNRVHRI